jgi:glycosyltransferase involved in cell wall biosynthesis
MSQTPEISVIIVTYNRLELLRKCMESLRVQTLAKDKYEVIVVDDGSTDGTIEYLKQLDWQLQPFVDIYFNEHKGYVHARNFGVSKATGKYVSFTDDDCIPEERWLEKVIETFEMDDSIGVVGAVTKVAFTNRLFAPLNQALRRKEPQKKEQNIAIIDGETGFVGLKPFSGCNLHIRKDIFERLNGFDLSIGPAEDLDFLYRYLNEGGKTAHRKDLLVDHYERDDLKSMFKRWFTFGKCDSEMVRRYLKSKFSLEINLFHGFLKYRFIKIPFPVGIYVQLNLFKVLLILSLASIFVPQVALTLLLAMILGLFVKQRNPRLTLSYLLYLLYLEASYAIGAFWGAIRKGVICL